VTLPSFRAFQIQVVYICAELYQISTGTPASRGPSAIAGLLVIIELFPDHSSIAVMCCYAVMNLLSHGFICVDLRGRVCRRKIINILCIFAILFILNNSVMSFCVTSLMMCLINLFTADDEVLIFVLLWLPIWLIFTANSELQKVLFLAPSVCVFCFCVKYPRNRWTDLHQIHMEDVFGPSLGRVWRSWSKVEVTSDKNCIFKPFWRPTCGLCLV